LDNDEFVAEFVAESVVDFDIVVDDETLPLGPAWSVNGAVHFGSKVGNKLSAGSGPLRDTAPTSKVENVEGLRHEVCCSRLTGKMRPAKYSPSPFGSAFDIQLPGRLIFLTPGPGRSTLRRLGGSSSLPERLETNRSLAMEGNELEDVNSLEEAILEPVFSFRTFPAFSLSSEWSSDVPAQVSCATDIPLRLVVGVPGLLIVELCKVSCLEISVLPTQDVEDTPGLGKSRVLRVANPKQGTFGISGLVSLAGVGK
jgi:hypothetical protein